MGHQTCCFTVAALLLGTIQSLAQVPTFTRADFAAIGAPRTVAAADVNRDGWPDLVLAGTGRDSLGILLNAGRQGGFEPVREVVVGGGPFEVAVADLNTDGKPDLAIANADLNAVTVLLGRGDGTFVPKRDLPVAGNPRGLAVADVDRDGRPDVIVTRYEANAVQVMFGDGDGGVRNVAVYPTLAKPQGVTAGDLNHDGTIELAVALVSGQVSVYALRSATSVERRDLPAPNTSYNVIAAGDFNHDGWLDLAAASSANQMIALFRGGPSGFAYYATVLTTWSPRGIAAADLNQDGWLDLVTGDRATSNVSVLIGRSDGSGLFDHRDLPAGNGSRDVALADFDRDGRIDIATANEFANSATVLRNTTSLVAPAFAFNPHVLTGIPPYGSVLAAADFNCNGVLDLVVQGATILDGTTVLRMFGPHADTATVGDFNADGHPDVAVSDGPGVRTYLSDGANSFVPAGGTGPVSQYYAFASLRAADVNGDGRTDIVAAFTEYGAGSEIVVLSGDGDGTFSPRWREGGDPVFDLEIADMNRDGMPDLITSAGRAVHVYLNDGAGDFARATSFAFEFDPRDVAVGDLDGDTVPEIALFDGDSLYVPVLKVGQTDALILFSDSPATLRAGAQRASGYLTVADMDNDGHLDVLTASGSLLRNEGDGNLKLPIEFAIPTWATPVVADYNGDGLLDVIGSAWGDDRVVALNRRTAVNRPPVAIVEPGSEATVDETGMLFHNYAKFYDPEDEWRIAGWRSYDPDMHAVDLEWRTDKGHLLGYGLTAYPRGLPSGRYEVILTARDLRGGEAADAIPLLITPYKEIGIYSRYGQVHGAWRETPDPDAALGAYLWHPNAGAPKVNAPLANPVNYVDLSFVADPTQEYKLWIRLEAENNHWGNDSVWVQFSGAAYATGRQMYGIGTTSALAVNLEECLGCGVSGWGWEDDGWGAVDRNGITLRFPAGGPQRLRIQTREDGVAFDQIVLSSEKYLAARPGTAKNDTTKVLLYFPWIGWWWE